MPLIVYALVDAALNPLPDTGLCDEHFNVEKAKHVASLTTEEWVGWRPATDIPCTICHRTTDLEEGSNGKR